VAQHLDLKTPEEDTGQTLGFYGVKPGPYLVLPLLPPFSLRDFIGYLGDMALNPINWLVAPIIEVEGIPSVIAHTDRMTSTLVQLGARAGEMVNERSLNLEKFQGVEEATLDLYAAVRNGYLQQRARAIRKKNKRLEARGQRG
jgi:phospholipid-binding lipoprotein MlaA